MQKGSQLLMVFARCILAVGLILAALSASTARAQEAEEFAAAETEMEYVEVAPQEFSLPVESEVPVSEVVAEVVAEPTLVPTPVPSPTPNPTATPTATPTAKPAPAPAGKVAAVVIDNRFQPVEMTVPVGSTVTWTNNGFNFHTLTTAEGLFNSGPLSGGQSFSYTFQQAGNFVLICRQHTLNGMTGRITVQ
jgi:plastocyanin